MDRFNQRRADTISVLVKQIEISDAKSEGGRQFMPSTEGVTGQSDNERFFVSNVVWSRGWQDNLPSGPLLNAVGPGDGLGGRV